MKDQNKTKKELINELNELRQRVDELEALEREGKQAEEDLQRERNLVNRITETSPVGITVVDREGKIIFANLRAEVVLGLTKSEITQRTYNDPEWRITTYDGNPFPDQELPFQRVMASGLPVHDVRHAIEWPNGRRVLLSINAAPLFDDHGKVDGMVSTVEDITERIQMEEEIRESEGKYKKLVEESLQGVVIAQGLPPRIIFANSTISEILGYSTDELVSLSPGEVKELIHPEDRAIFFQRYLDRLEGRQTLPRYEIRGIRKDGTARWAELLASRIEYQGKPAVHATFVDITEQKQAEDLLKIERDLGLVLSATAGLDETLSLCVNAAIRVSGMDCGGIYLVDETSGSLNLVFHKGLSADFVKSVSHYNADSVNAALVMAGKPIYSHHQELGVPLDETEYRAGLRAIAVIPVQFKDRVIACLNISSHTLDEVTDFARTALETIATQIGNAIIRAKTEETLRKSEANYRELADSIGDVFFAMGKDLKYTYWNKASENLIGIPAKDAIGKSLYEFFPTIRGTRAEEVYLEVLRTQQAQSFINQFRIGDKIFVFDISAYPSHRGLSVFVKDITGQKRMEEKILRQSAVLDAVNKVLLETLKCETEEEVARTGLAVAEELTGSRFGFIGEVNPKGRFDTFALSDPGWTECKMPKSNATVMIRDMEIRGFWGKALKDEQSLIVNDPVSHPESVGTPEGHPQLNSFLGVPLKHEGKTFGMIALANKESGYDLADQQDIETLSIAFVEALKRKRAEKVLRENKANLSALIENTNDWICSVDSEHRILTMNKAFKNMIYLFVKIEMEEGMNIMECVSPEHRAFWIDIHDRALKGEHISFEDHYDQEGFSVDVEVSTNPIVGENGEMTGVSYFVRDITERKRAEETLWESQELYRSLFEGVPIGLYRTMPSGETLDTNLALVKILGYPDRESLLVVNLVDMFVNPDERKRWEALMESQGVVHDFEAQFRRYDGTVIWIRDTCHAARHDDGQTLYHEGAIQDITEHKKAEGVLRESEETARQLSQENAIMAEIGRIISSSLNIDEVYERFAEELRKVLPFDRVSVSILNPGSNSVTVAYIFGVKVGDRPKGTFVPLDNRFYEKLVNRRLSSFIQTEDESEVFEFDPKLSELFRAGFRSIMVVPLISKDQVIGILHIHSLKLNAYTESDLKLAERVGNQIAGAVANAELFMERQRAEEALRESEETARQLSHENAIMAEIGQIISSTLNIDEVYERFAEKVRELIHFDRIGVSSINFKDKRVTISYMAGLHATDRLKGDSIPMADTLAEEVGRTRTSMLIRTKDMKKFIDRFPTFSYMFQTGIRSMIAIPLISKDEVIGTLHVQSTNADGYSEKDLRLAERVGHQIAGAIANAELFMERQRAEEQLISSQEQLRALSAHLQSIREEERTLVAREIHDELGQELTGLKMDLSWLIKRLPAVQEQLVNKVESMLKLIDTTIQSVRRISTKLRPGVLDDLGLTAAIEWQTQDFQNRTGIQCEFNSTLIEVDLDRDLSTAVFRTLQETLTNVARHASATRVNIYLGKKDPSIVLIVEDNGRGITRNEIFDPKSLGLLGMRERALVFGGKVEIKGKPGKGTTVTLRIPLQK